jgi:thymidine kinase
VTRRYGLCFQTADRIASLAEEITNLSKKCLTHCGRGATNDTIGEILAHLGADVAIIEKGAGVTRESWATSCVMSWHARRMPVDHDPRH